MTVFRGRIIALEAIDPSQVGAEDGVAKISAQIIGGVATLTILGTDGSSQQFLSVNEVGVAHPARALDVTFQPNTSCPTLLLYAIRIVSNITISGGERGRVELLADADISPTTVQARVAGGITGTVLSGNDIEDTVEATLVYLCPAGHNVLLSTVDEVGTPTITLEHVTEITL